VDSTLPSSIAAYLQEAGFSGTEIAVIRKLLEGDSLTLRELSTKTSKSTGVLDQAVKKLLKKGLVTREMINGVPRYTLMSVQTVVEWMKEDMVLKQEMLVRKHHNLESFVRSLTVNVKKRPEMEFFEGLEAMKDAYMRMLERGNDIVQYGPMLWAPQEDPLQAFWVEYFRERRRRGIFSRVLTHDTPQGRRYQSRDSFEYRKTILVDKADFPFPFEKIIIGDTLACFQVEDERACFIRYPELAQDERIFFEKIWNRQVQQSTVPPEVPKQKKRKDVENAVIIDVSQPSLRTRLASQLREFFLSRNSLITLAIFGFCALLATAGLYRINLARNVQNIREQALSIAATAAVQFDADDLDVLRTIDDIHRPEYKKVVDQLNLIRDHNPIVSNTYIFRLTDDPNTWEFVADADSMDPLAVKDLNEDGVIDDADQLSPPGEPYDVSGQEYEMDVVKPTVSASPIRDQWGIWYSANAPIRNDRNELVAILGIDIAADEVRRFSNQLFWMIGISLLIFFTLILIRFVAFYNTLLHEFWVLWRRQVLISLLALGISAICIFSLSYRSYKSAILREEIGNRLMAIASFAAQQINAEDIGALHFARDMRKEEYQRVFEQLNTIRRNNPEIRYVYILRPTETEGIWEYVADADVNPFNLFEGAFVDLNGGLDDDNRNVAPGVRYDIANFAPEIFLNGLRVPSYAINSVKDPNKTRTTGTSPIYDAAGNAVAVLGIDVMQREIQ